MDENISISVNNLGKRYKMYRSPVERARELISFNRVKRHEEFWALRDVSFDVPMGTTFGIVGQNGSGKSTLLQIISGILRPTEGSVRVSGRISALLELGAGFHNEFTGRENVYLQGTLMGITRREMDNHINKIEEFADIGSFIDQPVKTYSSGMYVRLAFATAINVDPDILIVDEVLAVGDDMFKRRCYRKIEEFQEQGKTILYVSHNLGTVTALCQRALLLDGGKLLEAGEPKDIANLYNKITTEREEEYYVRSHAKLTQYEDESKTSTGDYDQSIELRYGLGGATLQKIELINNNGERVNTLQYGEKFKIRLIADFNVDMENPSIGFMIKTIKGVEVYGTSTFIRNQKLGPARSGRSLLVDFDQVMLLNPGTYILTSAIAEDTDQGRIFHDRRMDVLMFKVTGLTRASGLIDMDSSIVVSNYNSQMPKLNPFLIVLGNQKSGTTAIASLLADYGDMTKTLDIPEIWDAEPDILSGELSLAKFINQHQDRFNSEVVKEPCLTFMYLQLLDLFPETHYVFVVRNPADNIRSILDRLGIPGNISSASISNAVHQSWRNLFEGTLLQINEENYIDRLAKRWVHSTNIYLENSDRMHLVRYEDFIKDKENYIKKLACKLNIEKREDISNLINNQYQPAGKHRETALADFFGAGNLSRIRNICQENMSKFNYKI